MPRGVPKSGFRRSKNWKRAHGLSASTVTSLKNAKLEKGAAEILPVSTETDAEIRVKLKDRIAAMEKMAIATVAGMTKSLIISGPPGVGKSYRVLRVASAYESKGRTVGVVKGFVRATGLYKTLYDNRHSHCVVIFDDADSIFADDASLNLLKSACDMTRSRRLSWLAETRMEDEDGEKLPRSFEFEGSIVFITNYDFDYLINKGNKLSPHFEAMISRSIYMDMAMKTRRDYLMMIRMVVEDEKMLDQHGFSAEDQKQILDFVDTNCEKLRELSLRMVIKISNLFRMDPKDWQKLVRVTCFRNQG